MRWQWAVGAVLGVAVVWGMSEMAKEARHAAQRSQCICHMKCMVLAMHNYHEAYGSFPPGTTQPSTLMPEDRLGWGVHVVEMTSGHAIRRDPQVPWHQPPNRSLDPIPRPNDTQADLNLTPYTSWAVCPEDPRSDRDGPFPYPLTNVGIAGLGSDAATLPALHPRAGVFGYDRVTKLADITDGTSNTAMFLETARDVRPWTAGGSSSVRPIDPATRPYLGPGRPFGGYHRGGANLALADGSIRFIRDTIDPKILEALSTIHGGETVAPDSY